MKDEPQPLLGHLEELRRRMIILLISFGVIFVVSLFFSPALIDRFSSLVGGFVFLRPTEALVVRLKATFYLAVFFTIPVLIFQIWRFAGLGLKEYEKRLALVALPLSYGLFALGVILAYSAMLPAATRFLLNFSSYYIRPLISVEMYLSFALWIMAAFGLLFQIPLVVFFLLQSGLVGRETLANYRPHVVVGLSIVSAFLTPGPDVFSQLALFLPAYGLFEVSLLAAKLLKKKQA